jgi:hypothetical protein
MSLLLEERRDGGEKMKRAAMAKVLHLHTFRLL